MELGSQKQVRVRGQKGPGVVKGKEKEKVVGLGRLGQDEIGELRKKVEEMGEELKEMKKMLKKIYEMGQMTWGEVIDSNDELELGYESSEVGTDEESGEESGLELEVGEEEWMEVEEERRLLRREVNRWEAKQAEKGAAEAEAAKEPLGSKYGGEDEEEEEEEEEEKEVKRKRMKKMKGMKMKKSR